MEFGEKKRKLRVLRRSKSFKVIEVGTNRKPICDFLSVINGSSKRQFEMKIRKLF